MLGKPRRINNLRDAANRHQNFSGAVDGVIDADFMRAADLRPAGNQRRAGIFQQRTINPFQPLKLGILGRD